MYSGTTLRNSSGNIMGAHQKIDRVARRALEDAMPNVAFPDIRLLLHFEGKNGPDGVKRKSPAQDEPWHYYQPASKEPQEIIGDIQSHYDNLVVQLSAENWERAAFEAAWLAHAIVDGLTPAHHYPYEEELAKIRGEGMETRDSIKDKLLISGDTRLQALANNWKMWGAKGLMTTHGLFELGVASIISPLRLRRGYPSADELATAETIGLIAVFESAAKDIDALQMYDRFYRLGWTKKLAQEVRLRLVPTICKTVAIAWYLAVKDAKRLDQQ
jgi:hypothetical protein